MEALVLASGSYTDIVSRLNRASVAKHFDAYRDVPWDEPFSQRDARWELDSEDALGATAWYQSQPPAERARIGLGLLAYRMKRGVEFENVLARGLLEFAMTRLNGSADFHYAYHELIEEGQHSLMFQEFVNRSGCDVQGMFGLHRFLARRIPRLGRTFPELFFVYVLAGEVPIDATQRQQLRRGAALHPLLRKIMHIHVSEEARHVCFAQRFLAEHLPKLTAARRYQLRVMAPFISAETTRLMLAPGRSFTFQLGIPSKVMKEAYGSARHRVFLAQSVRPLYDTFRELGLVSPATEPLWHTLGIGARNALPSPQISK